MYNEQKNIQKEDIRRKNIQHAKVVISGPRIRLIEVAPLGDFVNGIESRKKTTVEHKKKARPSLDEQTERFKSSLARSRSKVAEHIWNNFVDGSAFLTLTYAEDGMNVHRYDESLKHYDLFIKKLRKKYPDIKYIAVAEEQIGRAKKYKLKHGPIHYHLIVDKRNVNEKYVNEIWEHGHVFKKKTYGKPQKLVNYLTKYITKETLVRTGRKSYLTSRNLTKSIVIKGLYEAYNVVNIMLDVNKHELMYETSFKTFIGRIFLKDYYLPDRHLHFNTE